LNPQGVNACARHGKTRWWALHDQPPPADFPVDPAVTQALPSPSLLGLQPPVYHSPLRLTPPSRPSPAPLRLPYGLPLPSSGPSTHELYLCCRNRSMGSPARRRPCRPSARGDSPYSPPHRWPASVRPTPGRFLISGLACFRPTLPQGLPCPGPPPLVCLLTSFRLVGHHAFLFPPHSL
jgi:hypothetical protein